MAISIGQLDRRLVIQQVSVVQNSFGEEDETWTTLATVFGQRRDVTGREIFTGGRDQAEGLTRFVIRYRSDVNERNRISYDGNIFEIEGVVELGRKQWLELLTRRKDAT